jgi:hypothetical protein
MGLDICALQRKRGGRAIVPLSTQTAQARKPTTRQTAIAPGRDKSGLGRRVLCS